MSVPNPATTEWVPLWDLEGGVNLDYKGSWVAGSYVDGDVVVHQGVTYMCVRPTSAAPVPWPLASASASYGPNPPANPVDGQIWMLPVGDGVVWQFRYNAASASAYKWEFVGGAPSWSTVETDQGTSSTTYVGLGGPNLVLPNAGHYTVDFGVRTYAGSAGVDITAAVKRGAAATADIDQIAFKTSTSFHVTSLARTIRMLGLAAGATLELQYKASGGTASFVNRWMGVTPVRVS
jgi:hypothetical protein